MIPARRWSAVALLVAAGACTETVISAPIPTREVHAAKSVVPPDTGRTELAAAAIRSGKRSFSQYPDSILWGFLQRSERRATVGFRNPGSAHGVERGSVTLSQTAWRNAAHALRRDGIIVLRDDDVLPWSIVEFRDFETFRAIRQLPFVEYVEPAVVIDNVQASTSGCEQEVWDGVYPSFQDPFGDVLPAVYQWHGIDRAWAYAPGGRGVTLGLVDTGVDPNQPELGVAFATGQSAGRTIVRIGGSSGGTQANPRCTHGTHLAGVMAAPRNGTSILGVAWAANLVSAYEGDDIVTAGEIATQLAIRYTVDAGARVIEMAIGTGFDYSSIKYEIQRAYWNYDVVFVGAGGTWNPCLITNSNNILFPAELPEVVAVSPANSDGSRPCNAGYGPELDLIAYHRQPTTAAYGFTDLVGVSSSSHASALVAGMATLVRQRFPTLNNSQVVERLVNTAGGACGMPGAWHLLANAEAAVGGVCIVGGRIDAPEMVAFDRMDDPETKTIDMSVTVTGGSGPLEILWNGVYSGPTYSMTLPKGNYTTSVSVSVRDLGVNLPARVLSRSIVVTNPCEGLPEWTEVCR